MNITGEIKIFKRNYEGKELYSTSLTNKNKDGTYENMYISAQLPKGVTLENNTKINITKGFMSFYKDKLGYAKPKVVIQEFELENGSETIPQYEETIGYYKETDELPF